MEDRELEERIRVITNDLRKRADRLCTNTKIDPQDLFQDTYVKIWSNKHMYRYDDSFKAWCMRIMYNRFLDVINIEKQYVSIESSNKSEDEEFDQEWYQQKMLGSSTPNLALSDMTVEDMLESISQLNDKDKKIVQDFLIEGYTQAEIAKELATNSNNIKQRFFQAIRLVRADLIDKFNIDETYFTKPGLIEHQKGYRKRSTQIESTNRKKFNK